MKLLRRVCCFALCAAIFLGSFTVATAQTVGEKTLLLAQAQQLALAASPAITKQSNVITLKKMKYVEAVKGIRAKMKNLTSFRWTPLLSFKFPSALNLSEDFELNIKPLLLQTEISTLQHSLDSLRRDALDKVNKAYLSAYILQEKNAFTAEKLELAKNELARNKARLLLGEASQNDVDTMQKTVDKLTGEASAQARSFENAKNDLTDLIKLDVTSGYRFRDALFTARIPREQLEAIATYTLANSQSFYEVKITASTALLTLNSYESFMRGQYGGNMHYIQSYVNMARQGQDIDYAAFQIQYNQMLSKLDEPWNGSWRILFFKFPKLWFKGEIAGTRYIEDELYALYTACMEYATAKREVESAEKALRKEVAALYESVVTAGNAYRDLAQAGTDTKADYERLLALNRLGKASYSDLNDKKTDYQTAQLETLEALASYNELLYSFDTLTCGAVSRYFRGESLASGAGAAGDSFAEVDSPDSPYYYIYSSVADLVFVFGLQIPDGYTPEITHYELWYDGTQLGARTPVDDEIRHLASDYGSTSALTVKVFEGTSYVGECEIDTAVQRDRLALKQLKQAPAPTEEQIGSYTVSTSAVGSINLSKLSLVLNSSVGASYYTLSHKNGAPLSADAFLPLEQSFSYLTLLVASLDDVEITLYDTQRQELRKAAFHTDGQTIWSPKK